MTAQSRSLIRFSVANALVWAIIALLHAAAAHQDAIRQGLESSEIASWPMLLFGYSIWVFMGPLHYVYIQWQLKQPRRWLVQTGLGLMALLISVLLYIPFIFVYYGFSQSGSEAGILHSISNTPLFYFLLDVLLLAGLYGVTFAVQLNRLEKDRRRQAEVLTRSNLNLKLTNRNLQLKALQAQLEPHFLFNSLNAIAALVQTRRTVEASSAITLLSQVLRHTIEEGGADYVSLGAELRSINDYLALQQLRFGPSLQYKSPEPENLDWPIPPGILQPLVENAIKHTLEAGQKSVSLELTASETDTGRLRITLINTPSMPVTNHDSGLGLNLVRDRLALMYGDQASLKLEHGHQSFTATLDLPGPGADH